LAASCQWDGDIESARPGFCAEIGVAGGVGVGVCGQSDADGRYLRNTRVFKGDRGDMKDVVDWRQRGFVRLRSREELTPSRRRLSRRRSASGHCAQVALTSVGSLNDVSHLVETPIRGGR
jgi:hypothetical protein